MNDEVWEEVKSFYREKFGTAPELVELAPVLDLLRLCASGSSNRSIAKFFGETEDGLMELFDAHLGFMGWEYDLKYSPLRIYKELEVKDLEHFTDAILAGNYYPWYIDRLYEVVSLVDKLERLFDEAWI